MSATLPEGFELDAPSRGAAGLPPGFELDNRDGSSSDDGSGVSVEIGPKKSKKGNVERTVGVAATGFNKGLAEFAGLPVDIAAGALNLIPRGINAVAGTALPTIEKPFLGSEHIKALMSGAAMLGDEPETPVEKLLAGTFGEIGANVLPTGLMMRAGQKGAMAARAVMPPTPPTPPLPPQMLSVPSEAGSALGNAGTAVAAKLKNLTAPGMWESLVAPARTAPGAFAVEQNLIAGGAGLGGSAAEQLVGETENPYVQTGAKILGSLVGGLAPVGGLAAGRMLGEAIPVTEQQQRMAAARMLGIKPEMQLNLNAAAEAAPSIPGASYTAADLLNDQKLLAAQRGLQRSSPEAAATANEQRVTNANAYRNFAADEAPGGDVTRPKAAATEKVQEIAARRAEAIDQAGRDAAEAEGLAAERGQRSVQMATRAGEGNVAAARADAMQPLGDGVPAEVKAAASVAARQEIEKARDEAQQSASRLFRQVDPEGNIVAPTGPIERGAREIIREAVARGRPDAIPDIIVSGEIERYLGDRPIREIEGLRQRLGEMIRQEQRAPDSSAQKVKFLQDLKGSVDEVYERMAGGVPQERPPVAANVPDAEIERVLSEQRARWYAERGIEQPSISRMAGSGGEPGGSGGASRILREVGEREGQPGAGARGEGVAGASGEGTAGAGGNSSAPEVIAAAGERYRLARDFFLKNVVEKFRQGRIKDILAVGPDNLPKTKASDTLKNIVNAPSGKPEAVADFVRAVGGRPEAERALLDYAVADIADFARNAEGHLVSSKLQAWREKHAPVLRAFPEVDRVLSNVQGLQRRVDSVVAEAADRIARAETLAKADLKAAKETGKQKVAAEKQRASETQKQIDRSAAKFWIDKEPEKAVASVLSSGDPVKAAKQTLAIVNKGGAEAKRGVAQAAWDYALSRMFSNVEGEGLKVATTANFLEKNRDALRILLGGDGQLKKLEDLYRAAEINSRTGRANVRGGSDTAQNQASRNQKVVEAAKRSISTVLGAGAGVAFGGPIAGVLGAAAGAATQLAYERQRDIVRQLAGAALHDPEVFRTLTTAVTAANEKALAARLRGHIATLGLRQAEENSARP